MTNDNKQNESAIVRSGNRGLSARSATLVRRGLEQTAILSLAAGTVRTNSIGMELVYIPPGEFIMGSENGKEDEKPVHKVTISNGFWMSKYQVTQGQWESVTGETIHQQRDKCINSSRMGADAWSLKGVGTSYPMYFISWEEASEFVRRLNEKNDSLEYGLPTEAQWEYSARAGTTTDYAFGDMLTMSQANFYTFEGAAKGMTEVGAYQPNPWGLYDMHGNMWEFCQDWYDTGYYANSSS